MAGQPSFGDITTLSSFGTPFDLTVADLVIESLFPANESTAKRLRAITSEGSAVRLARP